MWGCSHGRPCASFLSAGVLKPLLTAALTSVLLLPLTARAQTPFVWTGRGTTSNFSDAANWDVASVPSPGVLADLTFTGSRRTTPSNDLTGLIARSITFDQLSTGFTTSGNALTLSGGGSGAFLTGSANLQNRINNALTLGDTLTVGGSGLGRLVLGGVVSGSGGIVVNRPAPAIPGASSGGLILLGANTFTGGVTLQSGNVAIATSTGLGTGTVTTTAGNTASLRFLSDNLTVANNFVLNGNLDIVGNFGGISSSSFIVPAATLTGQLSGSGGLIYRPNIKQQTGFSGASVIPTLMITNDNTFTGAVTVAPLGQTGFEAQILLRGAGTLRGTNEINLTNYASLTLDNRIGDTTRLNPNATINVRNGDIELVASNTISRTEQIATVNAQGAVGLYVGPGTNADARLRVGTLNHIDTSGNRATLTVSDVNLGGSGPSGGVILATDPGGAVGGGGAVGTVTQNILPYAIVNTAVGSPSYSFARYDTATGLIRALDLTTEVAGSLTSITPQAANVRLLTDTTLPTGGNTAGGVTEINALALDMLVPGSNTAGIGITLSGPGTLRVTGGAILSTFRNATSLRLDSTPNRISVDTLDFGGRTGFLHTVAPIAIDSVITGSGGIVKSGFGLLTLNGQNTFTGTVQINQGSIRIFNDSAFGNAANEIHLSGGELSGISFSPNDSNNIADRTLTLNRTVDLGTIGGRFQTITEAAPITLNLNGTIRGESGGNLYLGTSRYGLNRLTGNNAIAGKIVVDGGTLVVGSANALAAPTGVSDPGALIFATGSSDPTTSSTSFQNDTALTLTRPLLLTSSVNAVLIPRGGDLTLNAGIHQQDGGLNETSTLRIVGSVGGGEVVSLARNTFTAATTLGDPLNAGVLRVSAPDRALIGGTLRLSGLEGSAEGSASFVINPGGHLILDNTTAVNNNRVGAAVPVTLAGGNLTILGNANSSVEQRIGVLNTSVLANTITLAQPTSSGGDRSVTLRATSLTPNGAFPDPGADITFFRGDNLGGTTGNTTHVFFDTTPTLSAGGILPTAVGANSATSKPTDFVTYGPNGIQLFTNYVAPASGLTNTAVVSSGGSPFTDNLSVNALRITPGGGVEANVSLQSGALLVTEGTNARISGNVSSVGSSLRVTAVGNLTLGRLGFINDLIKSGQGTLTIESSSSLSSRIQVGEGTLRFTQGGTFSSAASLLLAPGATFELATTSRLTMGIAQGYGTILLNGGTLALSAFSAGQTPTVFSGALAGNGILETQGGIQVFNGASPDFAGTFRVVGSNVVVQTDTAIGGANTQVVLGSTSSSSGGTLRLDSFVRNFAPDITLTPSTTMSSVLYGVRGSFTEVSSDITLGHALTMAFSVNPNQLITSTVGAGTAGPGVYTFTGKISGNGSLTLGTNLPIGHVSFYGDNTYTGGTRIVGTTSSELDDEHRIGIGSDTAFGTGTVALEGTVKFVSENGPRRLANNITFTSRGGRRGLDVSGEAMTLSGNMDLGGGTTPATVSVANRLVAEGVLSNGALTKQGSGVLRLTNTNTYTGATLVSAGTLEVLGSIAASSGATVQSGAILAGTGNIPSTRLNSGGYLAPGRVNGSGVAGASGAPELIGALSGTSLTWDAGGTLLFDLGAGGASDRISLSGFFSRGTFTGNGQGAFPFLFADAGISNGFSGPLTVTLLTFDNTGNTNAFPAGNAFRFSTLGGLEMTGFFTLTTTQLNFTILTASNTLSAAAPEPGTGALLGAGIFATATWRRRKRYSVSGEKSRSS